MTPELEKLLVEWSGLKRQLEKIDEQREPIVAQERDLRAKVMAAAFPEAKEGTNTLELPNEWKLKGVVKIDRKVDEAALPATVTVLRSMGVNSDRLLRYKPELELKEYRSLTAEQMKIMDGALVIKRAASTLELVEPKGT